MLKYLLVWVLRTPFCFPNSSSCFQPMRVKVMVSFPSCGSTSAAGSQEQPEGQWADLLSGPFGDLPFHASANPPTPRRAAGGCHPSPAGPTPRKHSSGCSILVWPFGFHVYGRISLLDCCKLRSGLFVPVSALRVTIWHRTRLSSAAACQSHAGRVSATWRGGMNFSLRVFWKCELFLCRIVLTVLNQLLLLSLVLSLSWLVRIWLFLFGTLLRTTLCLSVLCIL